MPVLLSLGRAAAPLSLLLLIHVSLSLSCANTAQGVIWFKLEKGPLHLVADQYFKLEQIEGGDH